MNPRLRAALVTLILLAPRAHAGWDNQVVSGGCPDCGEEAASTFSYRDKVVEQSFDVMATGSGYGPAVDVRVLHNPAWDRDMNFDGSGDRELPHEWPFDLLIGRHGDTGWQGFQVDDLNSWKLTVDWNRDGTFAAGEVVADHTDPDLPIPFDPNNPYSEYPGAYRPTVFTHWNASSKVLTNQNQSFRMACLTVRGLVPASLSTPTNTGTFAWEFTYEVDPAGEDPTTLTNYGTTYIRAHAAWSSMLGPNWFFPWERHLEFIEATGSYGLAYTGPNRQSAITWISRNGDPIVFTWTGNSDQRQAGGVWGSQQYSLNYASFTLGGSTENFWELTEHGPGNREYYYPSTHATLPGKLRAVRDIYNRTVLLAYVTSGTYAGRIATITDASGSTWTFSYASTSVTIDYRAPGASSISLTSTFAIDSNGRLSAFRSPEHQGVGDTYAFTYGTASNNLDKWRVVRKTGLDVEQVDYTYNTTTGAADSGYILDYKFSNDNNIKTTYTYGYGASASDYKAQETITVKNPLDIANSRAGHTYQLMASGRVWRESTTYQNADQSDRLIREHHYYIDRNSVRGNFMRCATVEKDKDGTALTSGYARRVPVLDFNGSRSGSLQWAIDAQGLATEYTYTGNAGDAQTKMLDTKLWIDPTYWLQHRYTWTSGYGAGSVITKDEVTYAGNVLAETFYTYTSDAQLQTVRKPGAASGEVTTYAYYASGSYNSSTGAFPFRRESEKDPEASMSTPAGGGTTAYRYDACARPIRTSSLDVSGNEEARTEYGYDPGGRLTAVVEGTGGGAITTNYEYDNRGRLEKVKESSHANTGTIYEYDTRYRLDREKRCNDVTSGSPTCVTYAEYDYDALSRLTATTDARGYTLYNTYDARGRRTRVDNGTTGGFPCTGSACWIETYDYTVDSRLTHVQWDNKVTALAADDANDIWYKYDALGRLVATTTRLPAGSAPYRHVALEYESSVVPGMGKIKSRTVLEDNDSSYAGSGDSGEIAHWRLDYSYGTFNATPRTATPALQLDSVKGTYYVPGGDPTVVEQVNFDYNADGSLATVCESDTTSNACIYTGGSQSAWKTSYTYHRNGWLKSLAHAHGSLGFSVLPTFQLNGTPLSSWYDARGNRKRIDEVLSLTTYQYDYQYDQFSRLTSADTNVSGDADYDYTYDTVGNIDAVVVNNLTTIDYTTNYRNELTSTSSLNYSYDAAGNVSSRYAGETGPQHFWWDLRGRLVKSDASGGGTKNRFKYNPSGQRVEERIEADPATTRWSYVWDGDHEIAAYDVNGAGREFFMYGPGADMLLSKYDAGASPDRRLDYFRDPVNSVVRVVKNNGGGSTIDTVVQLSRYAPFGKRAASTSPSTTVDRFDFTGRESDELESHNTLYYRARWYDPEIGRFLSRDPWDGFIRLPASTHRYSYVLNNPVRYVDPTGLLPIDEHKEFCPGFDKSLGQDVICKTACERCRYYGDQCVKKKCAPGETGYCEGPHLWCIGKCHDNRGCCFYNSICRDFSLNNEGKQFAVLFSGKSGHNPGTWGNNCQGMPPENSW